MSVTFMVFVMRVFTWYVAPACVIELATEIQTETWQVRLPVWLSIYVQGVEQHLGVRGAASTLDLIQEMGTFCIIGGENLEKTQT